MKEDNYEVAGALRLPLGGINGYHHVRGGQGRKQDKFQGLTPKKTAAHRTKLCDTAREAALAPRGSSRAGWKE